MIKKLCCHPCCHNFRVEGSKYCEKHKEKDEARDNARKEEYFKTHPVNRSGSIYQDYYQSYRWHKESKAFIDSHPYCEICGRSREEVRLQVHHQWPAGYCYNNEADFFDKSHWVVCCSSCHARVTRDLKNVAEYTTKFRFDIRKDN